MQQLIERRQTAITKLSATIEEAGKLYREAIEITGELTKALPDSTRQRMPNGLKDSHFTRHVSEAVNAAMAGAYGHPKNPITFISGPFGQVNNTSLLEDRSANDHALLAE